MQRVGAPDVRSACELVRHDDRDVAQRRVPLTSASTPRPSSFGRLRSSRHQVGRGASACAPLPPQERERLDAVVHHARCAAQLRLAQRLARQLDVAGVVLHQQHARAPRGASVASVGHSPRLAGVGQRGRVERPRPRPARSAAQIRPAVPLDDLPADRQPDARALVLVARVQPLEDAKIRSAYCGSKPMPLSRTRHAPARRASRAAPRRRARRPAATSGAAELERVADQVLEQLPQLRRVGQHRRQRRPTSTRPPASSIARPGRAAPSRSDRVQVDAARTASPASPTRESASRSSISACMRSARRRPRSGCTRSASSSSLPP